jgi:hypothetical protein
MLRSVGFPRFEEIELSEQCNLGAIPADVPGKFMGTLKATDYTLTWTK